MQAMIAAQRESVIAPVPVYIEHDKMVIVISMTFAKYEKLRDQWMSDLRQIMIRLPHTLFTASLKRAHLKDQIMYKMKGGRNAKKRS